MKTVDDLIKALNVFPPNMPVQIVYDGMEEPLNIFTFEGRMCFSSSTLDPNYNDADHLIEFDFEHRKIGE